MAHSKETRLIATRNPNASERKSGAEIVFIREDWGGGRHTILGCKCYESWEQWGASTEVLGDNVDTIEKWRRTVQP
jgi:hypothetical protein